MPGILIGQVTRGYLIGYESACIRAHIMQCAVAISVGTKSFKNTGQFCSAATHSVCDLLVTEVIQLFTDHSTWRGNG